MNMNMNMISGMLVQYYSALLDSCWLCWTRCLAFWGSYLASLLPTCAVLPRCAVLPAITLLVLVVLDAIKSLLGQFFGKALANVRDVLPVREVLVLVVLNASWAKSLARSSPRCAALHRVRTSCSDSAQTDVVIVILKHTLKSG